MKHFKIRPISSRLPQNLIELLLLQWCTSCTNSLSTFKKNFNKIIFWCYMKFTYFSYFCGRFNDAPQIIIVLKNCVCYFLFFQFESLLEIMENAFYFIWISFFFVLEIFKFLCFVFLRRTFFSAYLKKYWKRKINFVT